MTLPTSERVQQLRTMTRRELEDLAADVQRALVTCVICGESGAVPFRARHGNQDGTLDVCPACFGKHRRAPSASRVVGDG